MGGLARLLTSGAKKHTILNIIKKQVVAEQKKVRSPRRVLLLSNKLNRALKDKLDYRLINDLFNEFVAAFQQANSRRDRWIHASDLLGGCPRALYYRLREVPETNEKVSLKPQVYMIFDVGTFFHRYIQNLLRQYLKSSIDAAFDFKDEVKVFNEDLRLTGHADGLLTFELGGTKFILEIKTMNNFAFARAVKANSASENHLYQASVYAKELKADGIIFIYVNKDTSEMREYVHYKRDYVDLQNDAYEKIERINQAVDDGIEPKRMCKIPTEDRALGCVHCNHCFRLKNN